MGSIRASEVQTWVATLDRSPSTVRQAHAVLAQILDVAVLDKRIVANPARGVKLPWTMLSTVSIVKPELVGHDEESAVRSH